MKPKSTYAVLRFILSLFLFLSCNAIMAQECTIDFSNFTIDTPDGTITIGDNATVCINQTVTLPNLNFQPGIGQPNPGIIWAVYDCQPTTMNPDSDPCKRPVVLRDPDGNVIIGGGEADFSFANLPSPGESEITVCLVPIIDGDTSGLAIEDDCTGIAVGLDYPCITFLVPEDNPTQCDSDCDAFEANDECIDAISLTLQAGTVVFPTLADSVYSNVCATREGELEVPNCFLDNNTANTVWFSFEGTGGEYTISVNACAAANALISDSQMAIYTGGCNGLTQVACNDDIGGGNLLSSITEFPTIEGTTYLIMVDGFNNESGQFCMEITETAPPCDANFGTVNFAGETTTCEGTSFNFTLTGASTNGFTSGFVVVNEMGIIVNIVAPGDINLAPGTYTIYAINFDNGDTDAVNGATTIEELNGLNVCAAIQEVGTTITVLFDGSPDCCEAAITSISAENTTVCAVTGESLTITINGANTGSGFANVWYYEQNGNLTFGGFFPSNVPAIVFDPLLLGLSGGDFTIFVVNVSVGDRVALTDAINAGADIAVFVTSDEICAAMVATPLSITVLPADNPDCVACDPSAGNSSVSISTICEGECIAVSVAGDNQNEGFKTLLLVTQGDNTTAIIDTASVGDFCFAAGTYTLYSFNFVETAQTNIIAQIAAGASVNDLQALIDNGSFCGMIEAEGTTVTFLPTTDDACFVCEANVGTVVNPPTDVTICFGEALTFQVEGDNTSTGFNTQFLGVLPSDLTISAFIEDNVVQVLPVGTLQFYAINFLEEDELKINEVILNGIFTDLLDLIDNNQLCAEIVATPIVVTVLPADHPSCVGDPFVVDFDITVAADGLSYTVTITMSGGSGDYTIDGNPVDGNTFVSDPIPCGQPFSFEASDGTLIEIVQGTSPCPLPCFANPGTMPQLDKTHPICDGDATNFNSTGFNLGEADVLIYVLHDNAASELGNVLAVNTDAGVFTATSGMNILTNTVYYISSVAGPDNDSDGIPDSDNECTLAAAGTPVVFLEPIELVLEISCDETTGDGMLAGQVFGGYPAFAAEGFYLFENGTFNGVIENVGGSFNFMLNDGDVFELHVTDGFCNADVVGDPFVCTKNPIELLSFEGEVLGEGNLLQWVTASETDNDYFTLERSIDGKAFEAIATINSQGDSFDLQSYDFLDRTALQGVSYYRLRQTDLNGLSTTSYTISLQRGERGFELIEVYPNPAKNRLNINFTINTERTVEISVYNITGQQLIRQTTESKEGINHAEVNVGSYPMGVYFVRISDGEAVQTQKFVKE
ncbi:MAG: T9SS type A sorting domain-containing protein [Chitinophagales bacterium]